MEGEGEEIGAAWCRVLDHHMGASLFFPGEVSLVVRALRVRFGVRPSITIRGVQLACLVWTPEATVRATIQRKKKHVFY